MEREGRRVYWVGMQCMQSQGRDRGPRLGHVFDVIAAIHPHARRADLESTGPAGPWTTRGTAKVANVRVKVKEGSE